MNRYRISSSCLFLVSVLLALFLVWGRPAAASPEPQMENRVYYLATTADWYFESNQNGAELGYSVHSAGDLNADGYDDIIIGSPLFIPPGVNDKDGAAFVFHGAAGGLMATPDRLITIGRQGSRFGCSVSSAGDVNGDGYGDVLVGADEYKVSFDTNNGDPKSGAVFLYLGSQYGLGQTEDWSLLAEAPEIALGYAVADAGDVNQDGYDDVLIGAPGYESGPDQSNEGKAYLFLGSPNGLAERPDWTYECDLAGAGCGHAVSSAGDLNQDGYDDIVIGAPHYNSPEVDEGAALVFLGSPVGPGNTPHQVLESDQEEAWFGESVAAAGDLNGDGYDDLIVGAAYFDLDEELLDYGAAFIYLGSPAGLGQTPDWKIYGTEQYAAFGRSLGPAGDINSDGFDDLIVGAYLFGQNGTIHQPDEGAVFLFTGGATGLTPTPSWSAFGNKADAWFGFSAGAAGDINGDGGMDLIVGAPKYRFDQKTIMGRAFVYLNTLEDFKEFNHYVFIPLIK